jgi:hypothetical protein
MLTFLSPLGTMKNEFSATYRQKRGKSESAKMNFEKITTKKGGRVAKR